jgi:hypothetical protein
MFPVGLMADEISFSRRSTATSWCPETLAVAHYTSQANGNTVYVYALETWTLVASFLYSNKLLLFYLTSSLVRGLYSIRWEDYFKLWIGNDVTKLGDLNANATQISINSTSLDSPGFFYWHSNLQENLEYTVTKNICVFPPLWIISVKGKNVKLSL